MKVIKKTESQSFVFPIQDELTENVVKFFNSLIALTIKSIIERKFITQNNVLYKKDLKVI